MNLIKLKDEIMPAEMQHAEYFNKHLKGRYAYWIQMRYIVSFDHMEDDGYIACEEDINELLPKNDGSLPLPYGTQYIDSYENDFEIIPYIDQDETDRINRTIEYRLKNSYVSDDDITIGELKMFRTWLANELLKMDQTASGKQKNYFFTDTETHVLQYYAADMYDETVKILTTFGSTQITLNKINTMGCNCCGTNFSSLYNSELNSCDSITIYKMNIYKMMVEMYSNPDFWTQWTPEFVDEVKRYIDNIIKCNFAIAPTGWYEEFVDCGCQNKTEQDKYMDILKRLSISLGYIKDGQISGHKNYINDALYDWSSMLYEKMQW